MSLQADRPSTLSPSEANGEASRRRRAIYQTLHPALSSEELQAALEICDREFPVDQPFSVSEFCQRLIETSSEIQLNKETRLDLLRTMRQPIEKLGSDPASVEEREETIEPEAEAVPVLDDDETSADTQAVYDCEEEIEMIEIFNDEVEDTDEIEECDDAEFDMMPSVADSVPGEDTEEMSLLEPENVPILPDSSPDSRPDNDDDDDMLAWAQAQAVDSAEQVAHQKTTGQPYHDDGPSPELFWLRYANFGKSIVS